MSGECPPKKRLRENGAIIHIRDNITHGVALFSWSLFFLVLESLLRNYLIVSHFLLKVPTAWYATAATAPDWANVVAVHSGAHTSQTGGGGEMGRWRERAREGERARERAREGESGRESAREGERGRERAREGREGEGGSSLREGGRESV